MLAPTPIFGWRFKRSSAVGPDAFVTAATLRKGTIAPVAVVSERSRLLSSICAQISLESNLRMIGFEGCVYVTARNSKGKSIGRTSNYKIIILQDASLLGKRVVAKISGAHSRYLEGTVSGFNHGFPSDNPTGQHKHNESENSKGV